MTEAKVDDGVIAMLVDRFKNQRLPRALALKAKVDRGEVLDSMDIAFLEEVITDTRRVHPLVQRHPECQELYSRAVHLYDEITAKALENESRN